VSVPGGFATTAFAFNEFLELSGLNGKIHDLLDSLDVDDIAALNRAGQQIRDWVVEAPFQPALEQAVREAYDKLSAGLEASFAVRSSATAEDMPDASFAGQQETFLNARYRCRHDCHQACVCLAVQRSRHLLPGPSGL
jgi:pyruvate,water dikinase